MKQKTKQVKKKELKCYSCEKKDADCIVITSKGHRPCCFDCVFDDDSVYSAEYKGEQELQKSYNEFLEEEAKRIAKEEKAPKGKYKQVGGKVVKEITTPQKRGKFTVTRQVTGV